jgi:putative membrane protein
LIAAGILAILNLLLKPVLSLLFFPINAISLGLFSIVINALVFYIFMRLVPHVHIAPWTFPGFSWSGIHIPSQPLPFIGTLVIASFLISLITNFLSYLND